MRRKDGAFGLYDDGFYKEQVDGSVVGAQALLGILLDFVRPASVLDVGCGRGAWLATAERLGIPSLRGIDGPWVDPTKLLSPNIRFTPVDFEQPIKLDERFDLCISVEVAEHLPASRAANFVATLCAAAPVVLFGAAVRHQGGTHHVNEQWQSYWVERFQEKGYERFDIFRGTLWDKQDVPWWYLQNTFLYVDRNHSDIDFPRLRAAERRIDDAIHPRNYTMKVARYERLAYEPTLGACVQLFAQWLKLRTGLAARRAGDQ